ERCVDLVFDEEHIMATANARQLLAASQALCACSRIVQRRSHVDEVPRSSFPQCLMQRVGDKPLLVDRQSMSAQPHVPGKQQSAWVRGCLCQHYGARATGHGKRNGQSMLGAMRDEECIGVERLRGV